MSFTNSLYDKSYSEYQNKQNQGLYNFATDITKFSNTNQASPSLGLLSGRHIATPISSRISNESELRGLNYKLSRDVKKHYKGPSCSDCMAEGVKPLTETKWN